MMSDIQDGYNIKKNMCETDNYAHQQKMISSFTVSHAVR